jgi:hypothetical protein
VPEGRERPDLCLLKLNSRAAPTKSTMVKTKVMMKKVIIVTRLLSFM